MPPSSELSGRFAREMAVRAGHRPWISWLQLVLFWAVAAALAWFVYVFIRQIAEGAQNWLSAAALLIGLLLFGLLLLVRINAYWARRRSIGRSDLRQRLLLLFAGVGVVPTLLTLFLLIAILAFGFSGWISRSLEQVQESQQDLAASYVADLRARMRQDVDLIAQTVGGLRLEADPRSAIGTYLQQTAVGGDFWQLYLYDASGRPLIGAGPGQNFEPILSLSSFRQASEALDGRLDLSDQEDLRRLRVLSLVPDTLPPLFVYGSRVIDPAFLETATAAQMAAAELTDLNGRLNRAFFITGLVMMAVTFVLLLLVVMLGLWFAGRLIEPIGNIIAAARDMGQGSLNVRVPVSSRQFSEYRALSDTFNTMASQLERQQDDLRAVNQALNERQQFTSAVLAGVSAGVLGLDGAYALTLPNRAAADLLGIAMEAEIGKDIREVLPEFSALLSATQAADGSVRAQEVKLFNRKTGNLQVLLASALAESVDGRIVGYVVTFDDVTELASAQRQSAWAEVARQIAHEIKNPLTPIQLSAERLRRRFSDDVAEEGREVFTLCLDTIARQVETISRLVTEFSSFSRMPKASLCSVDLAQIARQAFFLQASGFEAQDWVCDVPEVPVVINGDQTLIGQAIQNLLKNAGESGGGHVRLKLESQAAGDIWVTVTDTGPGFPPDMLEKLGTPYVSTKQGGTGLGLAIVKKIMEDHGGGFVPSNRAEGGAQIRLTFPAFSAALDSEAGALRSVLA